MSTYFLMMNFDSQVNMSMFIVFINLTNLIHSNVYHAI